jgi:bifunctional enzyme CysN/CysC
MSHQSDLIATDIQAYLPSTSARTAAAAHLRQRRRRQEHADRPSAARLHMIYEDQLAAIKSDSVKSGTTGGEVDLALLVDGCRPSVSRASPSMSPTATSRPPAQVHHRRHAGHEQYTRNMATGASTCDLAIILIDARHGVLTQTRRHSFIVSLLGISHVIVAINKMDLVGFDQGRFEQISEDYLDFAGRLNLPDIHFIPMSALNGDNVVHRATETPWFDGKPLLELLEQIEIAEEQLRRPPPPGAVCQPAQPRLPRLFRHARQPA